jgi:hypothetical protein
MAVIAAAATLVFYPVVRAHALGQIQLWIDLAFTLAVICWMLDRRLLAGALVGLACLVKPQLGLILIWALLWREWRFAAGAVLVGAPAGLISLLRYGLHDHLAYLQVLSFLSRRGESFFANNSVNGIANWYLSGQDSLTWHDAAFAPYLPGVHLATLAASAIFAALMLLPPLFARSRRATVGDLAVAAICTVVSSPVAWEHHYGLLLPLFLVALRARPAAHPAYVGALALAWTLTANFIPFSSLLAATPLTALQANFFFGALLLLGLFYAAPLTAKPAPAFADRPLAETANRIGK